MELITSISLFFLLGSILFSCKNEGGSSVSNEPQSPPADVHFELMKPEATGIGFANTIKETFQNNIITNSYLYNGGGVAVLDVNNDDLPDLYFTATQEANRLYLNKGDFKFEDVTELAGVAALGGMKTGVTVVDINADGFQDIYVCRTGAIAGADRENLLFVNKGNMTFTEMAAAYGLNDPSASNHANFFDYDLDGDLDAYVLNHPLAWGDVNRIRIKQQGVDNQSLARVTTPSDQYESDKLYRNDGNGRFTDVSKEMGIENRAWGLSVTASDFNNDGYPDLYIGNDYIEPDFLYINQKGKGFKDEIWGYFRHISNHTMGVDIADFNNDGLVDLAALDMVAEDNQRQKELMTTMVQDRYFSLVKYGYGHQHMRNVLQMNTGAAPGNGTTFSDIGQFAGVSATDWSWSPLFADFDNDGLKDLYITNGYRRDVTNLDYLNYTVDSVMRNGGITNTNFKNIDEYLQKIPTTPLRNYLFKNKDGMSFQNVAYDWGLGDLNYSNGSAYADLDKDGDLDLVVNQIDGKALVYRNKSSERQGANWFQVKLKGTASNPNGYGAKLRIQQGGNVQYLEMTANRGFFSTSEPLLHFGLGSAATVDKVEIRWPDGKVQALENQPANQRIVLEIANAKPGQWQPMPKAEPLFQAANNLGIDFKHVDDEFNDFTRERLLPHAFSNLGPNIAAGDVNGDGAQDVFIGGGRGQAGVLYLQQGGRFVKGNTAAFEPDAAFEDMGCLFFDADGDKDNDLYVVSGGSTYDFGSSNYQDRLYLNDGKGVFTKAPAGTLPTITASGSCVAAHDFDKDGDLDLFVGGLVSPGQYPNAPQTLVLQNNGGKFAEVGAQVAPGLANIGMVSDLLWADLDGDKNEELVVGGEWLPITVFKNNGGKLEDATAAFGLEGSNGWWNCLHAADLDKDGDMDLVGGNLGLNSRLKASADAPIQLHAADFDKNGSLDPVMTWHWQGKEYPVPQRETMIKQMPVLKKDFVYHKAYGRATIHDIFKASALEMAKKFVAKTFSTTVFINNQGKFTAEPLPALAQLSVCNQVASDDFNKDGNLDLLLVGNSFLTEVESGRYDAGSGTLLLGDGKGGFEASPNRVHGFWATKDARDMASVKLANGKSVFIVTNNNDGCDGYIVK